MKMPPQKLSDIIFLSLLSLVFFSIIVLVFFRGTSFEEEYRSILIAVSVFFGIPIFSTIIIVVGEKIGKKE